MTSINEAKQILSKIESKSTFEKMVQVITKDMPFKKVKEIIAQRVALLV